MMLSRPSLAAYPSDPYYDPARPSWLPYWIDDTTESQAKIAYVQSQYLGGSVTPQEVANPGSVYTTPPQPPPVPASGPERPQLLRPTIVRQIRLAIRVVLATLLL